MSPLDEDTDWNRYHGTCSNPLRLSLQTDEDESNHRSCSYLTISDPDTTRVMALSWSMDDSGANGKLFDPYNFRIVIYCKMNNWDVPEAQYCMDDNLDDDFSFSVTDGIFTEVFDLEYYRPLR